MVEVFFAAFTILRFWSVWAIHYLQIFQAPLNVLFWDFLKSNDCLCTRIVRLPCRVLISPLHSCTTCFTLENLYERRATAKIFDIYLLVSSVNTFGCIYTSSVSWSWFPNNVCHCVHEQTLPRNDHLYSGELCVKVQGLYCSASSARTWSCCMLCLRAECTNVVVSISFASLRRCCSEDKETSPVWEDRKCQFSLKK